MIIDTLSNKEYKMPSNVSIRNEYKYLKAITEGYAKYLEAISLCGGVCMLEQFAELINAFNKDADYSKKTLSIYASRIARDLEELGFVGLDFLNRYKYIYLRNPAFAIIEGDVENSKRFDKRRELRTNRFISSLMKLQYLIEFDDYFYYENMNSQLVEITKKAYKLILDNGNTYGYDVDTIEHIIELSSYEKVMPVLNGTIEPRTKLGVVRMLWGELGKEYWKLGRQSQTISRSPLYMELFLQDDGSVTIHYVPRIVVFDTYQGTRYYQAQSNKFFYMFFDLSQNNTQDMKKSYLESGTLLFNHFNRIGYSVILVGSDEVQLRNKSMIMNEHYYKDNDRSPLVMPCEYIVLDVNKYFKYPNIGTNHEFSKAEKSVEEILKKKWSEINE